MQKRILGYVYGSLEGLQIKDFKVTVENVSHLHAGHFSGNGETHFVVIVQSNALMNMPPMKRHRMLNDAVKDLINQNLVHSISFKCQNLDI